MKFTFKAFALLLIVSLAACKGKSSSTQQSSSQSQSLPAQTETTPNNASETFTEGVLKLADATLTLPEGYIQVEPSSQMRFAEIKITPEPEYELAVFYFGNQNMTDANIKRWKEQYAQLDNFENLTSSIENMHVVKLEGTFKLKPFPMSQEFKEVPGYATLAAIVPTNKGPYYLKMSAPKNILNARVKSFMDMLNSYASE